MSRRPALVCSLCSFKMPLVFVVLLSLVFGLVVLSQPARVDAIQITWYVNPAGNDAGECQSERLVSGRLLSH